MEFDDLVKVWRDEGTGDVERTRVESLADLCDRTTEAKQNARHQFRRAMTISIGLVLWFGVWALYASGELKSWIGHLERV